MKNLTECKALRIKGRIKEGNETIQYELEPYTLYLNPQHIVSMEPNQDPLYPKSLIIKTILNQTFIVISFKSPK